MKSQLEEAGPCRKVLKVSATGEDVAPVFEEVTQAFVKASRVRGFRPGKAPRGVVEKQYAKDIKEEVESHLLQRYYRQALKEHNLSPVAVVSMGEVALERSSGLTFQVTVDVPPDFALPNYERFTLKEEKVEVTDAQVDDAVLAMQDRLSRFEEAPGATVAAENLIQVDYAGRCGEEALSAVAPQQAALGEAKDFWMLVGARELLPGLSEGLLGAKIGEKREVKVTFPEDYRVAEVAGREAQYEVLVKRIRERKRPAVDAEFLKQCGVGTEPELRERLRGDLKARAEHEERMRRVAEIQRMLLKETDFEVPQSVMAQETDLTLRGMIRNILTEGGSREMIEENRDKIAGQAELISRDRVRLDYILNRIAEKENVEVDDQEVEERIVRLAASYNMQPQKLRGELVKRNGLDGVRSDLRNEKTMMFLLERVKIKKEE